MFAGDIMPNREQMAKLVAEEIQRLPPIPQTLLELRKASANPNVCFADLVPLIKTDPGMSANILRFANSARYGVGHPVDTLEEAVLFVGITALIEFVTVCFAEDVVRKSYAGLVGLNYYFDHSRQTAAGCAALAAVAGRNRHDQQTLGMVGLLHDIGKLILLIAVEETALPLVGVSADRMQVIVHEERNLWGLDHAEVGALLCQKWNFPQLYVNAIHRHHNPVKDGDINGEAVFVFLAHVIAVPGMAHEIVAASFPENGLRAVNLTPTKVAEAGNAIHAEPASPPPFRLRFPG